MYVYISVCPSGFVAKITDPVCPYPSKAGIEPSSLQDHKSYATCHGRHFNAIWSETQVPYRDSQLTIL